MKHAAPRLRRPRVPTAASLPYYARRMADDEARRYGVSRSWVIAVRLAIGFGADVPPEADYRTKPWRKR